MIKLKINNSFCEITGGISTEHLAFVSECIYYTNDIQYELKDAFFLLKRLRIWGKPDREIKKQLKKIEAIEASEHVFLLEGRKFPTGLLNIVRSALKRLSLEFSEKDLRVIPKPSLLLPWRNKPFGLRPYQEEAVGAAKTYPRGIFSQATGTGKTLEMAYIIKDKKVPTLIVTPSSGISTQIYGEFKIWFGDSKVGLVTTKQVRDERDLPPIRIMTIQSVASLIKTGDVDHLISGVDQIFTDEFHHCLVGVSKILTEKKGTMSIRQIVEERFSGKVLSFNSETQVQEYRKVTNWWEYDAPEKLMVIEYESILGGVRKLTCTENHKIFTTNRGYVEASCLTVEDDILVSAKISCPTCGKIFQNRIKMEGHRSRHKLSKERQRDIALKMSQSPNHNNAAARKKSSERMKRNNPCSNPEIMKRAAKGRKKWWDSLSQSERDRRIKIFQNAPKYGVSKGPTRLERRVIDLNIPEVAFTGDGKFWLTSPQGKSMNPDFKVRGKRKVIEVGDVEYWHTPADIEARVKALNGINFQCLYLTNVDLDGMTDDEITRVIKDFVDG